MFQDTVYTMDLRSAHKIPAQPPPHLHLSLTRSLVPDEEGETYTSCRLRSRPQQTHRKSKHTRSEGTCLNSSPLSSSHENWEEDESDDDEEEESDDNEEEQQQNQKGAKKSSENVLKGTCAGCN